MTKKEVFEELKEVIKVVRPGISLENVSFDTPLVEDLALDSLSMLLMSMAIENKLGIRFEAQHSYSTVDDVCDIAVQLMQN